VSTGPAGSVWLFRACAALALTLPTLLALGNPELQGGADLLPHLRLIELMGEHPALRSVYPPLYHVLGALLSPWTGLALYPRLFALLAALAWMAGFRYFQRAAGLPDACAALFVLSPYGLAFSWCLPKVEALGYGLGFVALGLLLRRRYVGVALLLAATFWVHTASAVFLGITAGVLALGRRDARGILALALGTLGAVPLLAAHLSAGCSLAQALLLSEADYLRATASWSSLPHLDLVVLLAGPLGLALAIPGAHALWRFSRPLAGLCAVLLVLYLNELWLAPLETRSTLDLLRGLPVLAIPVSISAGLFLHDRARASPWVLGFCAVWTLGCGLVVVPGSCYVRAIGLEELHDLRVSRCAFRWQGPAVRRPARAPAVEPALPLRRPEP
jgi:hypothetical protein